MSQVPLQPEQVTNEWLSATLGVEVDGFEMEQIGIGVGLLGRLYRVTTTGSAPLSVVAKFPTLDEGARMNVVEPLNFYEKEIRFYLEAASDTPVSTPRAHFAHFDPASRDFVLLLEDMGDRRMADQIVGCTIDDARCAVDAMVELHAHWWDSPRFGSMHWFPLLTDPPNPQVLEGMYKQSWPRALEVFGSRLAEPYVTFGERYTEVLPFLLAELTRAPVTYVHGDFRLDNLFFGSSDDHAQVSVCDWQLSFRGRGGYDLGYFVSQSLTTADRRRHEDELIARYAEGLSRAGIDYPEDDLRRDYALTIAFCFIYPVVSSGQIEFTNERQRELVVGMLDRAVAAIEDNDALALLP